MSKNILNKSLNIMEFWFHRDNQVKDKLTYWVKLFFFLLPICGKMKFIGLIITPTRRLNLDYCSEIYLVILMFIEYILFEGVPLWSFRAKLMLFFLISLTYVMVEYTTTFFLHHIHRFIFSQMHLYKKLIKVWLDLVE